MARSTHHDLGYRRAGHGIWVLPDSSFAQGLRPIRNYGNCAKCMSLTSMLCLIAFFLHFHLGSRNPPKKIIGRRVCGSRKRGRKATIDCTASLPSISDALVCMEMFSSQPTTIPVVRSPSAGIPVFLRWCHSPRATDEQTFMPGEIGVCQRRFCSF